MKRLMIPVLFLGAVLHMCVVNAENIVKENIQENTDAIYFNRNKSINESDGYQNFNDACTAYEAAQLETDVGKRSQFYAAAIKAIAKNISSSSADGESFLLASRIYRTKGGLSYAKNYLKKADEIFYAKVMRKPQKIVANLDYAVFCYAANIDNNHEQNKKAQLYAEKTLKLIETNNSLINEEQDNNYLRYKALANLVKGDIKNCEKFLAEAADVDKRNQNSFGVNESVSSNYSFKKRYLTDNIFYDSLFKDTVLQQKWIWPVAAKNVDKEFLLYYLTDLSRNSYERK